MNGDPSITDLTRLLARAKAVLADETKERAQAQLTLGYHDLQVANARNDIIAIERVMALARGMESANAAETGAAMADGLAAARATFAAVTIVGDSEGEQTP